MLIGFGCAVFLNCEDKTIGAVLFSVGLLLICLLDLKLYTGKIGYIFEKPKQDSCVAIWFGNIIGAAFVSCLVRIARPQTHIAAVDLIARKFELPGTTLAILAFLCGMVMHLAVENYRRHKNSIGGVAGIVLCVVVFIVCGFEHSIANMGYCVLAADTTSDLVMAVRLILTTTTWNGIGAIAVDFLISRRDAKT